jgi:hypothetical protein
MMCELPYCSESINVCSVILVFLVVFGWGHGHRLVNRNQIEQFLGQRKYQAKDAIIIAGWATQVVSGTGRTKKKHDRAEAKWF